MKKFFLVFLLLSLSLNLTAYNKNTAVKFIRKYQKLALTALDELDTDSAKKNLLKAISLIESYKLNNKSFADIYISAGVLNLMIDDGGEAITYFKKALELDPNIKIPENFSSKDVDAVFQKAKAASEKTDETFTFDTVKYKINYSPPKVHNSKDSLGIKVMVTPLPPSEYSIQVMFMSKGSKDFESLRLIRSEKNIYEGMIPSLALPRKELKLYILMVDNDLNPVSNAGSESNPFKIKISGSANVNNSDDDLDLDLDNNDSVGVKEKKDILKRKSNKRANDDFPIIGFKFDVGTGLGIAHGAPLYTSLNIDPGVAWSPAWISPDVSMYITPEIMIGISSRIQVIEKAWNAILKGQILIYNVNDYKLFTDFGVGYGQVRYRVDVSNAYPEQKNDVVIHGDIFFETGVSFVLMLDKNIGVSTSAKVNLIVPNISVLIDLGVGLYLEF